MDRRPARRRSPRDDRVHDREASPIVFAATPHIDFNGRARAALEFYAAAFKGELTVVTYGAMGQAEAARSADDVIWGQVAATDGLQVMAFDVQAGRAFDSGTNAFFVALRGSSADELRER